MDDVKDETNATPAWMTTQAGDVTSPPKKRKPRRTKAQMLADAEARPDYDKMHAEAFKEAVESMPNLLPLAPSEIASRKANHEAYVQSRLTIIAVLVSFMSLGVAITALVR